MKQQVENMNVYKETKLDFIHCTCIDTVPCVSEKFSIFRSSTCTKVNYIVKRILV